MATKISWVVTVFVNFGPLKGILPAERCSWLRDCSTRCYVPGFDSRQESWKFSSELFLLSAVSSPGFQSACNRSENRDDKSAFLIVPNVTLRTKTQNSIPLVFMTCYRKPFFFPLYFQPSFFDKSEIQYKISANKALALL